MNQEELTELLRSLPRENASAGFTTRVKARAAETRRRPRWTFAVATSIAALLLIATVTLVEFSERRAEQRRLTQLHAEKEQIAKELQELRSITTDAESRVVVGSNANYDLVLDVGNSKKMSTTNLPVVIVSDDGAL